MPSVPQPFAPEVSATCLDGHFPGRPILPGVVLLDAAIAATGLAGPLRIEQVKFLQPCTPGLALSLHLERSDDRVDLRIESALGCMVRARLRPLTGAPEPTP